MSNATKERAWLLNCAGGTFFTSMPRSKNEELKSSFKIIKNQIKFNATKERMLG